MAWSCNSWRLKSWLRPPRLASNPEAAALVGDLYTQRPRCRPIAPAAIMRRTADPNHKGAARALRMLHLTGAGVPRDQEEAARLFSIAAQGGDASAHVDLGDLLLRGHGNEQDRSVPAPGSSKPPIGRLDRRVQLRRLPRRRRRHRDDRKAAEWLRRAADGVINAQYWCRGVLLVEGTCRRTGRRLWTAQSVDVGMMKTRRLKSSPMPTTQRAEVHPAALALFEKAAGQGHVGAMFAVGTMYRWRSRCAVGPCRCAALVPSRRRTRASLRFR